MIQPKSPKVEKLQNTPSEPSCQPENGLLTFHSRTCKIASEREPAQRPNHFTFKSARTRPTAERLGAKTTSRSKAQGCASECWFARSPKHFTFERAAIHVWMPISSEPKLLYLWICWWTSEITSEFQIISHSNVQGSVLHVQASVLKVWNYFTFKCAILLLNRVRMQICSESDLLRIQMRWASPLNAILPRSQTTLHSNALGFASERDSPQEPNHFAFKCAGLRLWMWFSPGAKSLRI